MRNTLIAIPALLSTLVTAQQPSLVCHSDVGVFSTNGNTTVKFLPKSTKITRSTTIEAYSAGIIQWARVTMTPTFSGRTSTFTIGELAYTNAYGAAGTATQSKDQPHSWLLRVPANAAGNVLLVTMGRVDSRPVSGMPLLAQLDIGNDNNLEIDQDLSKFSVRQTFNLGTRAVDIRIVTRALLQNRNTSYNFQIGLTLNPDPPLKISNYGPMCGMRLRMTSAISGSGHSISCVVEGGFVTRGAVLMLGLQPISVRVIGTPCNLLVNPIVFVPKADQGGTTTFAFEVPGRIDGLIYLQAICMHNIFGLASVRMTNGVKVDGK